MPEIITTDVPVLDDTFLVRLDSLREHAVTCGRLDCGHLSKSDSPAVRRAVILYVAEGAGVTVSLDSETPEVAAVYGVMVAAGQERPVYTRTAGARRYASAGLPGMALVMPSPWGARKPFRITPQRRAVFSAMLAGDSASMIAEAQERDIETVKSHAGYLRRETGAHDAVSALISLVLAGRLADDAMTVPEDAVIPEPTWDE